MNAISTQRIRHIPQAQKQENQRVMKTLYTILYALSIILINPWGTTRVLIWTSPKVLIVWLIISLNIALLLSHKKSLAILQSWIHSLILWTIFLSTGAIYTLHSPFPLTSFLGQDQWVTVGCTGC